MKREEPIPVKQFTPSADWMAPTPPAPTPPAPTPPAAPTATVHAAPEPVVHKGIVCNMCTKIVVGVRHKCLDCAGATIKIQQRYLVTDLVYSSI
jgi:hypothetical protein